ncbi:unnamed protein product [Rotaria magnacalcarata]|uniref:Choline transporter-like protein n=1 Tax=Rotaria magnacalcarata TaxID=392030 RepID=A0A8S2NZV9_9BILA|nr:unnamed protein product [Rotaria magnacalcarata]
MKKCCHGYFNRCLCLQGLSITVRHGTIAFGGSIIAIIDVLRTLIDLIKDQMEKLNLDSYGKCCQNPVRCYFEFFSRYTYIVTAISGRWFCSSAFTSTEVLLSNCLRVFVLDRKYLIIHSQLESHARSNRLKEILIKSNDFQKNKIHIINDQSMSIESESKF